MRPAIEREGIEIPCVAANNDFSSPIPSIASASFSWCATGSTCLDLATRWCVLFAAWNGVPIRDGKASYDLVRSSFYTFERSVPYATWQESWNYARSCLKEAAAFGEEFGVVMACRTIIR